MTNFEVIVKLMYLIRCGKINKSMSNKDIYTLVCNPDDSDIEDESLNVL